MKRFLFMMIVAVIALPLPAQVKEGTISVSARENVVNRLPKDIAYIFPEFSDATVYYKDDRFSNGCLNICLLDRTLRYVENGDTLRILNQNDVRELVLADTSYRCMSSCVIKVISESDGSLLAQRFRLTLSEEKDDAGYSSLPATSTAVSANVGRLDPSRSLDTKADYSYKHERDFVLVSGDKIYPAKQSAFTRLFPDKKKEIKAYVKENKINFNSQPDLASLFEFCAIN